MTNDDQVAALAKIVLAAAGYARRDDVLEEAAAVCDKRAAVLNDMANAEGDPTTRFKLNTAWHETVDLAATIRAMKAAK